MVNVGINGFGRIGRLAFRIGLTKHASEINFGAVNTSGSMPTSGWAHLTNYDTTYRKFELEIGHEEIKKPEEITDEDPQIGNLIVKGKDLKVPVLAQKDPAKIPWGKYKVDVVI
ncbi:MAG: type I glyceraldehyde-3-phosphate dehydrogenase, partial [Patescibacteria group bacterium]|nr:type I glyceraldehyde-3-phosphate dehydrogenase [Patescibacteria group bacterium]